MMNSRCAYCGDYLDTAFQCWNLHCPMKVPTADKFTVTPTSYPLAGRPEDLAEIARLRAQVATLEKERDEVKDRLDLYSRAWGAWKREAMRKISRAYERRNRAEVRVAELESKNGEG